MELALDSEGAQVTGVSCTDPRYPPENILDASKSKMWITTGCYPQEFMIHLGSPSQISKIKTLTTNVRRLTILRSDGPSPSNWETTLELELKDSEGVMQVQSNTVNRISATFLKFQILEGWQDFSTVHRVSIEGKPV